MSHESLEAHLNSLITRHRDLDNEIQELEKSYAVTDEVRRLKTQKLWLKDEIHRVQRQLLGSVPNGFN